MKTITAITLLLLVSFSAMSQIDQRTILHGTVLYRDNNVIGANVVNNTSQQATITDFNGRFSIRVKEGDELIFSSLQYKIKSVTITKDILRINRLVVEVKEKVTQLTEVVVGPENQEKFLDLKEEEFERYDYTQDKQTRIRNTIMDKDRFYNGVNFVNIYKAIFKRKSKEKKTSENPILVSGLLREMYEDEFFVADLGIPQDRIADFLYFCDEQLPSETLLLKDNEFQLIDFLVNQSKEFLKG